jgi:hypothetical protein
MKKEDFFFEMGSEVPTSTSKRYALAWPPQRAFGAFWRTVLEMFLV